MEAANAGEGAQWHTIGKQGSDTQVLSLVVLSISVS